MLANRSVLVLAVGLIVILLILLGLTRWYYLRRWAKFETLDGRDRRYYRDIGAVLILLGLVAGFFWEPLFNSGYSMPNGGGDLVSFFYPIHVFASNSLWNGEFPFWDPNLFSGMPFAADIQSGVFYPLNWLFWLLGHPVTYEKVEMLALVHYWLAASFTYGLARSLNLGRWPSLVAGTIYAFSGFAVSHLGHLPMLAAATWLPLILLAVNQAARPHRRALTSWRWAVAAGLFLAISFLAGHFQLFLYNFYAAVIFWLAIAWKSRVAQATPLSKSNLKSWLQQYWVQHALKGVLAGSVMGLAVLVQLGPFYQLGQLSVRSSISYETSTQFGVWPIGLADLLLPNLFSPNPQAYFGYWSNTDVLGYVGLFTFALAGLGVLVKTKGRSSFYPIFFLTFGLAGLIFSLSGYTIFQGWFYQFVPALDLTRASGRFLDWFTLGIGLAAAFGLQNWLSYRAQPPDPATEKIFRWGWRGLALAVIGLFIIPLPLLFTQVLASPGSINDLMVRGVNGLVMAGLMLGLGAILLRLLYHRSLSPDSGAFLVTALVIFDLFSARSSFNVQPGNVADGFFHDDVSSFLQAQDPTSQYRIEDHVGSVGQIWQPNTAQLYDLHDVRGVFNPLQLANYETLWNAITSSQKDFRAVPAYNLFGARYILARNKEEPTGPQYKIVYQDTRSGVNLNISENSQALPRAWLVHTTTVQSPDASLTTLISPTFQPTQQAYLASGQALSGTTPVTNTESVQLTTQSTNQLSFTLTVTTEGYVVINQNYYPGWTAKLEGQTVPIERADYTLQGVHVGAGQHQLTLEFTPTNFWLYLIISAITWLIALGFLAWPIALRKRSEIRKFRG